MFSYSLAQIAHHTNSTLRGNTSTSLSNQALTITSVQTDSRNFSVSPHTIFLALVGKQRNAHSFIAQLYEQGQRIFWVQEGENFPLYNDAHYIISASTLAAFQQLMQHYREQFSQPLVAITGSNGKTICKEWLYHILKHEMAVVRSPKSYNSQIGVPLSLMLLQENYNCAIMEAGISQCGEMEHLEKMLQPTIGIFTTIGDAHQENFQSIEQKVAEKMKLFAHCKQLVYCADYELIHKHAQQLPHTECVAWSFAGNAPIQVSYVPQFEHTIIYVQWDTQNRHCGLDPQSLTNKEMLKQVQHDVDTFEFTIPFNDSASIENAVQCFICARLLSGVEASQNTAQYFSDLPQIAMRLEQIAGTHNCTIINDSYNSDLQSVTIALQFLSQQKQHDKKTLILSDVKQTGIEKPELYRTIAQLIQQYDIQKVIGVGNDVSTYLPQFITHGNYFQNTQELLAQLADFQFADETILLKAAREYEFEKIAQKLELQTHQTVLEINLNAMIHNLNYFKSQLLPATKIMVMVKAFSYGSGSYEIANILQHQGVDYLAVAFVDEGIELRNAGIRTPIVVMNPEYGMLAQLYEYDLEPNIHNFNVLAELADFQKTYSLAQLPIHIKLDTGMARYGFGESDVAELLQRISAIPNCHIQSVFSHLVGSDEERFDEFTLHQIELFTRMSETIQTALPYPVMRHILNSAGIERFAQAQFDMVRLGIGLYGISAVHQENCMHVSTLKTCISDIRTMQSGETVGYCRNGKILRPSKIAVLPIGYADGLRRKLGNGVGHVLIGKQFAPIIGNVCMDATMIDITEIDTQIGAEVIIFGTELPISDMAAKLETIPYEVITSISRRVKRVYYYE
ncbi:MAG: bifunctional UDP-N-acetylmuramoyl-tripeptide:D-alanyl-D-alanine ligase/alanine racemase [Bacteroidetes bacterium]|nr:bifunctional UDP-N-acetylmuramoyl-tripeptide:D-alanyl-D-alanine ligase/alanine racemase [Bacteroidota bacterium]